MGDPNEVDLILRQLDQQRDAYLAAFNKAHELLAKNLASSAVGGRSQSLLEGFRPQAPLESARPLSPLSHTTSFTLPTKSRSPRPSFTSEARQRQSSGLATTLAASSASRGTGEDSDNDEDDEDLYVQVPLEHALYDHEGLRQHLRSHKWNAASKAILDGVINKAAVIQRHNLFPVRKSDTTDRSHLCNHQVFDVGTDGAPLPVELPESERGPSNALTIWNTIREINRPEKARRAVGRITIVQEPSPMLFAAVHYVGHNVFDVDQIFDYLHKPGHSSCHLNRAFEEDVRRQRSFVFSLEYFTIIGDNCEPKDWQLADRDSRKDDYNVPITRCSSVIALSLSGNPIRKVKNHARRKTNSHGHAYDPFSSWQVLNVQCYPDWKSSTDTHDSAKHYVNGVEAFLVTLLSEFRDAQARFEDIYRAITRMITPPSDFMFNLEIRDKLQFEDKNFTYTRRYFWAYQTLGTMNDSIKAIIDAFEDTFVDDVWDGKHKTIWPLLEEESPRSQYYKKRMASLRTKFQTEITKFKTIIEENTERRKEIHGLREQLFSGTSIQESRKSVENTEITIQQGHNIKILTLVSIFFLPLTFVTSVFGMTNMPAEHNYWHFGIVTSTVCVPFFVLIGSLNTNRGMTFWRDRSTWAFMSICAFCKWIALCRLRGRRSASKAESNGKPSLDRSATVNSAALRLRRWSSAQKAEVVANDTEKGDEESEQQIVGHNDGPERPTPVLDLSQRARRMSTQWQSTLAAMWAQETKKEDSSGKAEV